MTAAAGIGIATEAPASGQALSLGTAHGLAWGAGKAAVLAQSTQGEAQSFRSSWQSFLASVGLAGEDFGASPGPASSTSGATQTHAAATASGATASLSDLEMDFPETREAAWLATDTQGTATGENAGVQQPNLAGATVVEKSQAKPDTAESATETRTEHSRKGADSEPAAAAALQATAPLDASATSLPAVIAAPAAPEPARVAAQEPLPSASSAEQTAGPAAYSSGLDLQSFAAKVGTAQRTDAKESQTVAGMSGGQEPAFSSPVPDEPGKASGADTFQKEAAAGSSALLETNPSTEQTPSHAASQASGAVSALGARNETSLPGAAAAASYPNLVQSPVAGSAVPVKAAEREPDPSGGNWTARQTISKAVRANGSGASAARTAVPSAGQSGTSTQDLSSPLLTRDPSAAHPALSTVSAGGSSVSITGSTATSDAAATVRETFAALDAETGAAAPTWVHAGARQAEAGFQDPALGWVGVRAQVDASGVHAALVPGSADAAQSLGGHLAGLNAYLAEQHTQVETLTLAAPETHWAGQSMDQGSGQNGGQGTGQGGMSGQQTDTNAGASAVAAGDRAQTAVTGSPFGAPATEAVPGGVYISVMA